MQSIAERRADMNATYIKRAYLHEGKTSAVYGLLTGFSTRKIATTADTIDRSIAPIRANAIVNGRGIGMDHWPVCTLTKRCSAFIREDGALVTATVNSDGRIIGYSYVVRVEELEPLDHDLLIAGLNRLLVRY